MGLHKSLSGTCADLSTEALVSSIVFFGVLDIDFLRNSVESIPSNPEASNLISQTLFSFGPTRFLSFPDTIIENGRTLEIKYGQGMMIIGITIKTTDGNIEWNMTK